MTDMLTAETLAARSFSLEEAIQRVAEAADITEGRKRDIRSSLSTVARLIGLPPSAIPMNLAFLREHLLNRSAAQCGVGEARMRNIRSHLRYALGRLGVVDAIHRSQPTEEWADQLKRLENHNEAELRAKLEAKRGRVDEEELERAKMRQKAGLMAMAGYCSAMRISPSGVDAAVLKEFTTYLITRAMVGKPTKLAGTARATWNRACRAVDGWVGTPIAAPGSDHDYILPLLAFTEAFRTDLDRFAQRLGDDPFADPFTDLTGSGDAPDGCVIARPSRALRPITVESRKSHCRWAASALVATGVPIETVTSLNELVTPTERVSAVLRFLWERAGRKRSADGTHVAGVLRMIAKYHARLPESEIARIKHWARQAQLTYRGMTPKNESAMRAMMTPENERALLALPDILMEIARRLRAESPRQAASVALRAVAIGFLQKIPLRLANLRGLRRDTHLQCADLARDVITHIQILADEFKTERDFTVPVSASTAALLREWIRDFRPLVASPDCLYLFPGDGTGNQPIGAQGLRDAIKTTMRQHVGIGITPHQFRHLAAHLFLRDFPGHYEEVRLFLGHASIATTIKHYAGTQVDVAVRRFDELIEGRRGDIRPAAKKRTRRTKRAGARRMIGGK